MIIRQYVCRSGRTALAKPSVTNWKRALATAVAERATPGPGLDVAAGIGLPTSRDSSHDQQTRLALRQSNSSQAEKQRIYREDWQELEIFKSQSSKLGAAIGDHYEPRELVNNPPWPEDITLELLMASQSHLGHYTGLWHPANARYIHGIRDGIHIISLDVTASHLRRACKIVEATAQKGGVVLFVGTRKGQARSVVKAAKLSGGYHLFDRWTPGTITNRNQILRRARLRVADVDDNSKVGFEEQLTGKAAVKPDLVVCLNPLENHVMLRECRLHSIPTIGVVDTDCNPTLVTYPIPANDDSRRCTNVIMGVLGRAGQRGRDARRVFEAQNVPKLPFQLHDLDASEQMRDATIRQARIDRSAKAFEKEHRRPPNEEELKGMGAGVNNDQEDVMDDSDMAEHVPERMDAEGAIVDTEEEFSDEQRDEKAQLQADNAREAGQVEQDTEDFNYIEFAQDRKNWLAQKTAKGESGTVYLAAVGHGKTLEMKKTEYDLHVRKFEILAEVPSRIPEANVHVEADQIYDLVSDGVSAGKSKDEILSILRDEVKQAVEGKDPDLARLVARKRRALGEGLTAEDKEELKALEQIEAAERTRRKELSDELAERAELLLDRVRAKLNSNLADDQLEELKNHFSAKLPLDVLSQLPELIGQDDYENGGDDDRSTTIDVKNVRKADEQGLRQELERRRSTTAHYAENDRASIGPVTKNRKGRPAS